LVCQIAGADKLDAPRSSSGGGDRPTPHRVDLVMWDKAGGADGHLT